MTAALPTIAELIASKALFVVNHSAGKDSQAMLRVVRAIVPADQIVIIHAELPEVDWEGLEDHIRATSGGLPVYTCRAVRTFFDIVEARGRFPSPKQRWCTSDLKRGPITKVILRIMKERGLKLVVNCEGIRAEESTERRKLSPLVDLNLKLDKKGNKSHALSKAGRQAYQWLPIHDWKVDQVWRAIRGAGQQPHPAYAAGMSRLSCCFCIMARRSDLKVAAGLKPELARRYAETERRLNQTMSMPNDKGVREFLDEWLPVAA
jgi:DNA sulfur modification protein DndC